MDDIVTRLREWEQSLAYMDRGESDNGIMTDIRFEQRDKICKAIAEIEQLRAFANEIMNCWPEGPWIDGDDLQVIAVRHGLLEATTQYAPCREEGCTCALDCDEDDFSRGIRCYQKTALLRGQK